MTADIKNYFLEKEARRSDNKPVSFWDDFWTSYSRGEMDFSYISAKDSYESKPPRDYTNYKEWEIELDPELGLEFCPEKFPEEQKQHMMWLYDFTSEEYDAFLQMPFQNQWEQQLFLQEKGYSFEASERYPYIADLLRKGRIWYDDDEGHDSGSDIPEDLPVTDGREESYHNLKKAMDVIAVEHPFVPENSVDRLRDALLQIKHKNS